jgi:hypothetical protein
MKKVARFSVLALLLALPSFAQLPTVPASDPQALAIAAKTMAILTGGSTIVDATLTGNAIRLVGPDYQQGTVTLKVSGTNQSSFHGGKRSSLPRTKESPETSRLWVVRSVCSS